MSLVLSYGADDVHVTSSLHRAARFHFTKSLKWEPYLLKNLCFQIVQLTRADIGIHQSSPIPRHSHKPKNCPMQGSCFQFYNIKQVYFLDVIFLDNVILQTFHPDVGNV